MYDTGVGRILGLLSHLLIVSIATLLCLRTGSVDVDPDMAKSLCTFWLALAALDVQPLTIFTPMLC